MVHAGASTSCRLLSALLAHPKYLLMTAHNEMAKFPPSVVLPRRGARYTLMQASRHYSQLCDALQRFLNYGFNGHHRLAGSGLRRLNPLDPHHFVSGREVFNDSEQSVTFVGK